MDDEGFQEVKNEGEDPELSNDPKDVIKKQKLLSSSHVKALLESKEYGLGNVPVVATLPIQPPRNGEKNPAPEVKVYKPADKPAVAVIMTGAHDRNFDSKYTHDDPGFCLERSVHNAYAALSARYLQPQQMPSTMLVPLSLGPPRKHWTLLKLEFAADNKIHATLYDSQGGFTRVFPTNYLQRMIIYAFPGYKVDLTVERLGLQHATDHHSCGKWTAFFAKNLALGLPVTGNPGDLENFNETTDDGRNWFWRILDYLVLAFETWKGKLLLALAVGVGIGIAIHLGANISAPLFTASNFAAVGGIFALYTFVLLVAADFLITGAFVAADRRHYPIPSMRECESDFDYEAPRNVSASEALGRFSTSATASVTSESSISLESNSTSLEANTESGSSLSSSI